jgi:hypothetical protein
MANTPESGAKEGHSSFKTFLWVCAAIAGGAALAVIAVLFAQRLGASPKLQRIAAYGGVASAMVVVASNHRLRPTDPVTLAATLVGLSTVVVSVLLYVGPIEKTAAFGCIKSQGKYDATISGESAIVYTGPSASNDATRLLLQGCVVHFDHYCIGAVHHDIIEREVLDSRWLILPGKHRYLASGFTVSAPPSSAEVPCADPISTRRDAKPPDRVSLISARIDQQQHLVRIEAVAPRAAFVGFAYRHGKSWWRLGWDVSPSTHSAVLLSAPATLKVGDPIAAVACVAFNRPARRVAAARLYLEGGVRLVGKGKDRSGEQPKGDTPEESACNSGVLAVQ